jgi:hypothetical protein
MSTMLGLLSPSDRVCAELPATGSDTPPFLFHHHVLDPPAEVATSPRGSSSSSEHHRATFRLTPSHLSEPHRHSPCPADSPLVADPCSEDRIVHRPPTTSTVITWGTGASTSRAWAGQAGFGCGLDQFHERPDDTQHFSSFCFFQNYLFI